MKIFRKIIAVSRNLCLGFPFLMIAKAISCPPEEDWSAVPLRRVEFGMTSQNIKPIPGDESYAAKSGAFYRIRGKASSEKFK